MPGGRGGSSERRPRCLIAGVTLTAAAETPFMRPIVQEDRHEAVVDCGCDHRAWRFDSNVEPRGRGDGAESGRSDLDCEDCCVTCEGVRYCACKVATICAECCCWQCCHIITSSDGVAASAPAAACSVSRLANVKASEAGR